MTIHRNTTYIKFKTARESTASKAGDVLIACREYPGDYWKVFCPSEGKRYQATASIIRAIAGDVIEQDNRALSLDWRLSH